MAISLDIVAVSQSLLSQYSVGASLANETIKKLTNKDSTGAAYDFTNVTGISLTYKATNPASPLAGSTTITPNLIAHDATGLTFEINQTQWANLANVALNANYVLTVTDGSNSVIVATGQMQVALSP